MVQSNKIHYYQGCQILQIFFQNQDPYRNKLAISYLRSTFIVKTKKTLLPEPKVCTAVKLKNFSFSQ